jgi:hypothetical protein
MIDLIIASVMGASLGVTITKLTGIGDSIGFKPFNCFVCLSFWSGALFYLIGQDLSTVQAWVYSAGAGFTSAIFAYFLIDRIYR